MPTIDLSQSIRNVLSEKHPGKSRTQMGREMKVDSMTLKRALDGETTPRYATLSRIAAYCGVSPDAILNGYGLAPEPGPQPQQDGGGDDAFRRGYVEGFGDGFERGRAAAGFASRNGDPALN